MTKEKAPPEEITSEIVPTKPAQEPAKDEEPENIVYVEKGDVSDAQIDEINAGDYYTIKEVATKLRYTTAWITALVQSGRIKAIKPAGMRWRIPKSEYERLLREGIVTPVKVPKEEKPEVTEIDVSEEVEKKVTEKTPTSQAKKGIFGEILDFSGLFK